MARLDARLAGLMGDFPSGPVTAPPRSGKTPSPPLRVSAPQGDPADRAVERRRSPPISAQGGGVSSEPGTRRTNPELRSSSRRASPELSADDSRNDRPGNSRNDSPDQRPSVGKRRSAANLAAAAAGGDGPSPNTREGTRKSPSNGDPLPGKKADGWKKGMPSCGVASGAAKAERKHSVRAAQEIAISPPASPYASPRVDRVSPTTTHGDLGHLACCA